MALDKLVDSAQLNSNLTSIANAIRTKSGTTATLTFPTGFVNEINNIVETNSNNDTNELMDWLTGSLNIIDLTGLTTFTRVVRYVTTPSFTVNAPDLLTLPSMAFQQSTGLTQIYCPKVTSFGSQSLYNTRITMLIAPSATSFPANFINGSSELLIIDAGINCNSIGGSAFNACSKLATLVLRKSNGIVSLANTNVFTGTLFASDGSGGTIYIPKSLYDSLGTGTNNDYKTATNWSTIDGYGTITWAQIEGSYYETHYADGTIIS